MELHESMVQIIESRQRTPKKRLRIISADKTNRKELGACAQLARAGYLQFQKDRVVIGKINPNGYGAQRDIGFVIYRITPKGDKLIDELLNKNAFSEAGRYKVVDK